jgi:hypothetical protein
MAIIKPEQLSSGTYSISGSFSGSFHGDGSDLNNLPSNVISTGSYADFPDTGSEGYIYIDNSANIGYLWDSGSIPPTYVNIAGPSTPPDVIPLTFANAATVLALVPSPLYNNGISGSGAVLTGSINGVLSDNTNPGKIDYVYTPVVGDVILIKNQPTGSQNGLYTITSTGSVSSKYVLTRTDEYDVSSELFPLQVNILTGTNNNNKSFIQSTANPVIGTSSLVFSAASPAISVAPQIAFIDTVIDTPLTNIVYATGSFSSVVPGNGATITSTVSGSLGTWNGLSVNTNSNITGSFTKVLVINQTNPAHNGDYSVLATGSATVFWKLQRINNNASGFDRYTRFFLVSNTSSSKAGRMYFTRPNSPALTNATIGTAPINIFEYGGSGSGSSAPTFPFTGSAIITGSLTVTGSVSSTQGFTGSLLGTASLASTASFVVTAQTASYVLNAQTASYVVTAQTASYVLNAVSSSFATTASYALNALSASWAPASPVIVGPIGVANSLGVYTYYNTFSASVAAAPTGSTVEFFADIIETGSISVNLRNGININGNGHTYTLNTAGTASCIIDNGVAVSCSISNITFTRLGGTASSTNTLCMYITGGSIIRAYGTKLIGGATNMRCLTINNLAAQVYGVYAEGYNPCITITNGQLFDSTAKSLNGTGITVEASGTAIKCVSYGFGADGLVSAGNIIDCVGYGSLNNGITATAGLVQDCTGYGGGGFGLSISGVNTVAINSSGYSPAGAGVYTNSTRAIGLKGYSTSNRGIYLINGVITDCTGYSTANQGIYMENSGATISELRSCKAISTAAAAIYQNNLTPGSKIYNTEAISRWNNALGHGIMVSGSNTEIVQCVIETTSALANCIFPSGSLPSTVKYANNAFRGANVAVNANITQGMINTHDNQGNIII